MRGAVERLAPLATIYVVGVSYDPFVSGAFRCSIASCASKRPGPTGSKTMLPTLAAIRPVVTSQLLGAWLHERDGAFTADEACARSKAALRSCHDSCSSSRSCAANLAHGSRCITVDGEVEDLATRRRSLSQDRGASPSAVSIRARHPRLSSRVRRRDDRECGLCGAPGWRNSFESVKAGAQRRAIRSFDSPVGADHAVRRNEKRERRRPHGCGNATMRTRTTDGARDVGVRNELAKAERCDGAPRCELKRRPVEKERQIETA